MTEEEVDKQMDHLAEVATAAFKARIQWISEHHPKIGTPEEESEIIVKQVHDAVLVEVEKLPPAHISGLLARILGSQAVKICKECLVRDLTTKALKESEGFAE